MRGRHEHDVRHRNGLADLQRTLPALGAVVSIAADPLEKVIRPIVEGQIRGFLHEHPAVVNAVDWFKKSTDKISIFTNSLSKRILLDLLCEETRGRMEDAFQETWEAEQSAVAGLTAADGVNVGIGSGIASFSDRGTITAAEAAPLASRTGGAAPSASLLPQIAWGQA